MSFARKTLLLDSREGYCIANNSHAVNFTLLEPIDNLCKVKITSFEYFNYIPNVRGNGLDTFNVSITDASGIITIQTYTIATKNYADIAAVITALNNAFSASLPTGITALAVELYQEIYIRLRYTLGSGVNKTVRPLCDTVFAQELLGFTKINDWTISAPSSTINVIANQPYNMSYDTYIQLDIPNLTQHPVLSSGISKPIRIPLASEYGMVSYLNALNGLNNQVIDTHCTSSKINTLQFRLYDRFGNPLTNVRTCSWSATCELYFTNCGCALNDANI